MEKPEDHRSVTESAEATESESPINLALLVDDNYLDRFASTLGHMVIGLIDEVVNVTVVCPNADRLADVPTGPAKVIAYRGSRWPWPSRGRLDALVDELEQSKVGLIHAACGRQARLAGELAGELDTPYLVSATGLLQEDCDWTVDSARCRGMIAISEPIRRALREVHPSYDDRIHLVRPGCFCRERPPSRPAAGTRTIVSAGFFTRRGGYDLLLRVLGRLAEAKTDCLAFLFGTGPLESVLRRWTRKAGLGPRVTFLAPIAGWQQVLDDADVYIQPGAFHQLHSGPYEALARGCPVIGTEETAFDLVVDGETGRQFTMGDEQGLADILTGWLGDAEGLETLSAKTGRAAKERLSLPRATSELVGIYRAALNHERV